MTTNSKPFIYTGKPNAEIFRNDVHHLPQINLEQATDPARYVAPLGLRDAVNVALELGLPLLLTGEPGVGKSSLAYSLNRELGYQPEELLHFTVKSDTRDSELFYNYDTLGRFHAVHGHININDADAEAKVQAEADPRRFIRYQALGMAILQAKGRDNIPPAIITAEALAKFSPQRRRAVVLIDEIDKAPRDMPNDILNEIERMEFRIPELFRDEPVKLEGEDKCYRPIVIITSNSERDLPEAFLRRCLYYDLSMPKFKEELEKLDEPQDVSIEQIVASRLGEDVFKTQGQLLQEAIAFFSYLRNGNGKAKELQRKPSLAELLDWLRYLVKASAQAPLTSNPNLEISIKATLLKQKKDQQRYRELLDDWNF